MIGYFGYIVTYDLEIVRSKGWRMPSEYIKYKEMLQEFKSLSCQKNRSSKTFMSVSGYPHFENVASNILAFFFVSGEEHGLGDLFCRSLLEAVGENPKGQSQCDKAEREYPTMKGNRIDLVLTTDKYVVDIENKIYSGVQNDLPDYKKTIDAVASNENKRPIHILLSLSEEKSVATLHSFHNLTYKCFFEVIRSHLGNYLQTADATWIIYLKDFMNTIDKLQRGFYELNNELMVFVKDNYQDLEKLLIHCNGLKKDIVQITKDLRSAVDLSKYGANMTFTEYCYNPPIKFTSSYVIDIQKMNGRILVVESYIDPIGWHIAIWDRFGKSAGKNELDNALKKMNIPHHNDKFDTSSYFHVVEDYTHDIPIDDLIQGLYKTLDLAMILSY